MKKLIFTSVLLLLTGALFASMTNKITYQGKLKEYGIPANGNRHINIRIWDNPSVGTGNLMYNYDNLSVPVSSGIFSVTLTPSFDWSSGSYYLETTVEGKTLSPREEITTQMYALHSLEAENIKSDSNVNFIVGTSTFASITTDGNLKNFIPTGAILPYGGHVATVPVGWFLCDGAVKSKTTYPDLFAVIGYSFGGSGDNFYLPDLKGMFLRGLDTSGTYDVNGSTRTIGSYQEDTLQTHHHTIDGRSGASAGIQTVALAASNGTASEPSTDITAGANIGAETRPKNVAVNYIIKY